jgi:hypothetical protein
VVAVGCGCCICNGGVLRERFGSRVFEWRPQCCICGKVFVLVEEGEGV